MLVSGRRRRKTGARSAWTEGNTMELPVQVTTDEVHAHPPHTGHRLLDLVLALSAIFISVVSLVVAIEHGRTERELVAANSWPFVQADSSLGQQGVRLWISNAGIGPAKLESLEVLYNGEVMPTERALLERCCGVSADPVLRKTQLTGPIPRFRLKNSVMRPGEDDTVLTLQPSYASVGVLGQLSRAAGSISYRACYCSVFDECWLSNLQDLRPRRVASCPMNDRSFNEDASTR